MAVRKPLFVSSGNLQEMTTAMVDEIVDGIIYQYSQDPSVVLTVGSSGNIGTINDTRKSAGAQSTSASSFPSEGTTQEPQTVTVSYNKVTSTATGGTPTADTGKTFPVYYNSSGQIQAMNLQDVKDTFLHPAIDLLTSGSTGTQQGGTYTVTTSSTAASGFTNVSTTAIFTDTRADTSAYSAGSIPETQDQPTTITNYYLHRVNGASASYTEPYFLDGSNNIQEFTTANWNSLMLGWIKKTAADSSDGYAISYTLGTTATGNTRGSGMADTILNGSGNYQTRQVNNDDYRAQEFPNGSATTANTYYLRIIKS